MCLSRKGDWESDWDWSQAWWVVIYQSWGVSTEESALTTAVEEDVKEILLLHRRLGHVPFESLSRLHPDAFKKVDRSKLLCDACELGKHTRSIYPSIDLRSCEPFMLIHSDFWGPCSVTYVSRFKRFVIFIDCYTVWHVSIWSRVRIKLSNASKISISWSQINLMWRYGLSEMIMESSMWTMILGHTLLIMGIYIKPLVMVLHRKMV